MTFVSFASREDAGQQLATRLKTLRLDKPVVLALPRGGVPVAAEVARALGAPLDLVLVRKIGVPWQPELAAAAIADGEQHDLVLNDGVMQALRLRKSDIADAVAAQLREIERRRQLYVGEHQPISVRGRTAIVVDDGIATGTTARAAVQALRRREPKRLILAVPVGASGPIAELSHHADQVICLQKPQNFEAIGQFYKDFHQLDDEEVMAVLRKARHEEKA